MQIQYQLALFEVDVCYLALISDTSDFHIWRIDANKKDQGDIIDLVGKMLHCIENGIMPRELAMNADDIAIMYPEIQKDFIMLNGEKLDKVIEACKEHKKAGQQIKNWEDRKKDASNAIAVYLKDYEEIRNGSDVLAKWETREGSEKMVKIDPKNKKDSLVAQLKKNDKSAYRYLLKREYIAVSKDSRFVKVKFKGE